MNYAEAAREIAARLARGGDDVVAAGAIQMAIEAWKCLAGTDLAWDRFGLELLDVRARLYSDHDDVLVDADVPVRDDAETRLAVTALLEQLARHHDRLASDDQSDLARRLSHDAGAQQLRRAVAALA
ncbi:hypothetical protein KBX26_02830 [Micromonospora sp. C97]|uniref:hypothetical protein n=1 Tax=Micromonospora sp. C97 TaxID=2824883 RepID=UPI001B38DB16|nr:hypothetical protein [Micromonospora sp. C97]MBQ1028942.1 hypothetical protein [Micromonospora sp. C97]